MHNKVVKIILGILIDCTIAYCLSRLLQFLCNCNLITCILIVSALYVVFAWLNHWVTPGRKLMKERKEERKTSSIIPVWKIFLSSFFDWFLIFSFTLIINLLLRRYVYCDTIILFTIIAPLYYIFLYLTVKQTFGYFLFQIELIPKQGNKHWNTAILKRELLKYGLGAWLPLFLLTNILHVETSYFNASFLLFLNIIVLLFYYAVKGEAWWNTIAQTQPRSKKASLLSKGLFLCGFFLFIGLCFFIFRSNNNTGNPSANKLFGFNIPFKRIEYPDNCKVKTYSAFLEK